MSPAFVARACSLLTSCEAASAVWTDDAGQGLAEYGLVLGFIAVLCTVALIALGAHVSTLLTRGGTSF